MGRSNPAGYHDLAVDDLESMLVGRAELLPATTTMKL